MTPGFPEAPQPREPPPASAGYSIHPDAMPGRMHGDYSHKERREKMEGAPHVHIDYSGGR